MVRVNLQREIRMYVKDTYKVGGTVKHGVAFDTIIVHQFGATRVTFAAMKNNKLVGVVTKQMKFDDNDLVYVQFGKQRIDIGVYDVVFGSTRH